jgi:ferredoxin
MKRKIINIDDAKCNGCGLCITGCPEGALQLIEGKARLVSDFFCDGLGACIGNCPQNAITVTERDAEAYDEKRVMANIVRQGAATVKAHLLHLIQHGETGIYNEAIAYLKENNIAIPEHETAEKCGHEFHSCPGFAAKSIGKKSAKKSKNDSTEIESELRQWPIQLMLINPAAPYFDNVDLLISADCVPFAHGNFHRTFLRDKIVIMFCPKLDPHIEQYIEKMTAIFSGHKINSITIVKMEVPCCGGINHVIEEALKRSGKQIPVKSYIIKVNGEAA